TITSSTSSAVTVDADHLVSRVLFGIPEDKENKASWSGDIKATNDSDNSFTLGLKNGRTVKVAVSSSTAIALDGAASTLAALDAGDEVKVAGSLSADGSVVTATKINAETEDADEDSDDDEEDEDEEDEDEDKDKDDKSNNGRGWFMKFKNWIRG
ncbi:MAG: DUF5666 domain-containing protein, partial [bacterium]|nr:DUF5666 domain-containing protein [bacterium]